MIKSLRIFFITKFFRVIPETRGFALKSRLLRWAGGQLGHGVRICSSVTFLGAGGFSIGDRTWVGHQSLIVSACFIQIGDDVDIGPRVYIGTGTHELDAVGARSGGKGVTKPIIIGDGVWLGAGCSILPGVKIGEKAVIAAGAIVTADVPARSVVGGVPAKKIRDL